MTDEVVGPDLLVGGDVESETIDFDKADIQPSGKLVLSVKKAVAGTSKEKNLKITLHLNVDEVVEGDPELVGRTVFEDLTFTKSAAFRVKQAAKALGVSLPSPFSVT